MRNKILVTSSWIIFAAVLLVATVSANGQHNEGKRHEIATIQRATARYHQLDAALADGYEVLFDCTVNPNDPTEAMGQHYINFGLKDDRVELAKPEVLMYEPQANGKMKLVGVEYVIFEEDWTGSEAPRFLDQEMHYKTAVGVHPAGPFYELHAWVWKHNPNGVFADWNPTVSCEHSR